MTYTNKKCMEKAEYHATIAEELALVYNDVETAEPHLRLANMWSQLSQAKSLDRQNYLKYKDKER
jgi:hypothetical protein